MDAPAVAENATRLALPYRCSVVKGSVVVEPSLETTLDITGPHEQRLFTTCDPPFSNNCRSLTVHKFDVACGQDRVPWHRVVAAIGRTTAGDAAMSKGHLVLTREAGGAASGSAPSCKDRSAAGAGGECLPWSVRKPTERLVLPQGFAPVRETGARFIGDTAPLPSFISAGASSSLGAAVSSAVPYRMTPDHGSDDAFGGLDQGGGQAVATNVSAEQDAAEGWTTSLSFNTGEEQTPELIVATSSVSGEKTVNTAAAAAPSPDRSWMGALMAALALAAAFAAYRMPGVRFAAPGLSGTAAIARRKLRTANDRAHDLVAGLRQRLAETSEPEAEPHAPPGDPALSSALLQLRAMHARTEAAVAMLSSATVVREVMQTELTAIRARIEDAERASRRGSTPVMKLAAQFRQIARDIERVQGITQSAAQSTAGPPAGLPPK